MGTEGPRWWPQLGSPAHHLRFSTHNLLPVLSSSRLFLIFFFSVYMGLTCSSSLPLWKSNPGSKENQSTVVRIRIKGQDSNSALAGLYGHSSVHCSCFKSCPTLWNQTRILEWVAKPSSRESSWLRDRTPAPLCFQHWQVGSLPLVPPGKPYKNHNHHLFCAWVSLPLSIHISAEIRYIISVSQVS